MAQVPIEDKTLLAPLPCSNFGFILQCHYSSEPLAALLTVLLLLLPLDSGSSLPPFSST